MILFFFQVLCVPDRLHELYQVVIDAAVAVLRHGFVTVANGGVAFGPPPSGWRLEKLPGASQGFYLFLTFFVTPSFLLLLPVFLLCLFIDWGSPGSQTLWFMLLVAIKTSMILESSASSFAC